MFLFNEDGTTTNTVNAYMEDVIRCVLLIFYGVSKRMCLYKSHTLMESKGVITKEYRRYRVSSIFPLNSKHFPKEFTGTVLYEPMTVYIKLNAVYIITS